MTTPTPAPAAAPCPVCGHAASGRFCDQCGAALAARSCRQCSAPLSPIARFCHRCGTPAAGRPAAPAAPAAGTGAGGGRTPWLVAGLIIIVLVGAILANLTRKANAPAAPAMANAGNAGGPPPGTAPFAGGAGGGAAPDISQMSPEERFNRLYDRIMRAASASDSAQVVQFTPMALQAYAMLERPNADLRYHAAILNAQVGRFPEALALADSILAANPDHLFGYVIRGDVARLRGDSAGLARARAEFEARHARETARQDRVEYVEHRPALDEFRK